MSALEDKTISATGTSTTARRFPTPRETLYRLSVPEPNTGCWLWMGATTVKGYGCMRADGTTRPAHRVSFSEHVGDIPDGLHVLHRCDMPACVNPDHLFLGTNADNVADKMRKGRSPSSERRKAYLPRGENHWSRKGLENGCRKGHPWTNENTRRDVVDGLERRYCRQCERDKNARQRAKRRLLKGDRLPRLRDPNGRFAPDPK